MWIGHRERPNELLMKDPSLLSPEARPMPIIPAVIRKPTRRLEELSDPRVPSPSRVKANFSTFKDGHDELAICEAIHQREVTEVAVGPILNRFSRLDCWRRACETRLVGF